ncbi:MAG: hypothetical protein GC182_12355 [Rhodopseudomonas sp.]|nr:hypothetical protein [Rhodopseudomonas sp.]
MNWRILLSPYAIGFGYAAGFSVLFWSVNLDYWLAAFAALLVSVMLVFDDRRNYPALIWAVAFNWLGVAAGIFGADLAGFNLTDDPSVPFHGQAVDYGLVALVCFSAGIAISIRLASGIARVSATKPDTAFAGAISVPNGALAYVASLLVAELAGLVASRVPSLTQPLTVLYLLKFICIYLVAVSVLAKGRGYAVLVVILFVEVVNGMTSFFGTFKESFFLVLIALIAVGRRPSLKMAIFGAAAFAAVFYLSLLWTAAKPEYRAWVSGYTGEQAVRRSLEERIDWMANYYAERQFDHLKALGDTVERVDGMIVFAQYLARLDAGIVVDVPSRFLGGIEHVLMPRVLFPNKPIIDDSAVTTAMTGRWIGPNTSISIGYIAEAYYDFGPVWMFAPIFAVGLAVGAAGRYFMTRDAPYVIRQAFTVAVLFDAFQFGINFNKSLGTFLMSWLVLALVLKFGYPLVSRWLSGGRLMPAATVELTGAE